MAEQNDYTRLIVVAGVAGLAWYGYEQGWFNSLLPSTLATTPATPVTTTPVTVTTPVTATPVTTSVSSTALVTASSPATSSSATSPALYLDTSTPSSAQQTTAAALTAANSSGQEYLDADQWQYYWNQLGYPAIPSSVFVSAFFPNGRPASSNANTQMDAISFVLSLGSSGVSGLGNYEGIPMGAIHGGW